MVVLYALKVNVLSDTCDIQQPSNGAVAATPELLLLIPLDLKGANTSRNDLNECLV